MSNPSTIKKHPRRTPAHLSVSLRHESFSESSPAPNAKLASNLVAGSSSLTRDAANESRNATSSISVNAQRWFEQSNEHPPTGKDRAYEDNEPPFFQDQGSNSSNSTLEHRRINLRLRNVQRSQNLTHSGTNGSGSDDYRSVIDDLTIENRKLKEKLRRYEASYNMQLEKDKLFELKVHGLPTRKKRELEDTLRAFASNMDGSAGTPSKRSRRSMPGMYGTEKSSSGTGSKNNSTSSTSNSRPINSDSAYASMSTSGPTSNSKLGKVKPDNRNNNVFKTLEEQKVQSFLHDIPQGLLAGNPTDMTEKQKKKEVVRRLERLFTGKSNGVRGDHSQPLQQQEVSKSAARADRAAKNEPLSCEGVREAHILRGRMEVDSPKAADNARECSDGSSINENHDSGSLVPSGSASPEQRPTRPLDLDPDREQIPSDNVEYIRHLGLSTPQLITENSSDVELDADGWVYLNLLFGMAQLHILSVSTDFVKSAVAEVSEKFQLSPDGRKIRWRGGTEGTYMSSGTSESEGNHQQDSPVESDSHEENRGKRPKMNMGLDSSRLSVPVRTRDPKAGLGITKASNIFHYKPIFRHQTSSDEDLSSYDGSGSRQSYFSDTGMISEAMDSRAYGSGARSSRRKRDGPIVFYSGAQFCVDYSGDRDGILTPQHNTNHSQTVLGAETCVASRAVLGRTPSGSFLAARPFKDYSIGPAFLQTPETRPKTPDLLKEDDYEDFEFMPGWALPKTSQRNRLQAFTASGLGGTRPADHFAISVKTRRTKLDDHLHTEIAASSAAPPHSRKFLRKLQTSSLQSSLPEGIDRMQGLRSASSDLSLESSISTAVETPVRIEAISTSQAHSLEPSFLPAPTYLSNFGNSEDESDVASSIASSGVFPLRQTRPYPAYNSTNEHNFGDVAMGDVVDEDYEDDNGDEDDDDAVVDSVDDDDDDSSIDFLAHARDIDPDTIAAREEEFESHAKKRFLKEIPAGSSAATIDGGSGYSSEIVTVGSASSQSLPA
ncbi:hypothetical protein BP5796_07247 [Coleophoma crateriformis]|uniref:Frequency clock protein n=1 Tax=Coleophoma crateriformis TaxID=565419 RepID=A0A3D8RID3_9HELO|nr:hypothetical protein BP5796_07247 [Coleophoma crateriformis]